MQARSPKLIEAQNTNYPDILFHYAESLKSLGKYQLAKEIYEKGISHINIGTGRDLTISELANLVSDIVGFTGEIVYDTSKPDGVQKKLLDVTRLHEFGWKEKTSLEDGIRISYDWFVKNYK